MYNFAIYSFMVFYSRRCLIIILCIKLKIIKKVSDVIFREARRTHLSNTTLDILIKASLLMPDSYIWMGAIPVLGCPSGSCCVAEPTSVDVLFKAASSF